MAEYVRRLILASVNRDICVPPNKRQAAKPDVEISLVMEVLECKVAVLHEELSRQLGLGGFPGGFIASESY